MLITSALRSCSVVSLLSNVLLSHGNLVQNAIKPSSKHRLDIALDYSVEFFYRNPGSIIKCRIRRRRESGEDETL